MIILIAAIVILVVLTFAFFLTYSVIEPNKAHIVIFMGRGRKVYSPTVIDGKQGKTAYFFIPFLMKRAILPLANVKMELPSFELRDKNVAPFVCEVTCWLRIRRPEVAIEKLDIFESSFEEEVMATLKEQVSGIARASAMNQEILEIMKDRKAFGDIVEKEVNGSLEEWGLELVKLEIVDFSDAEQSNVIANYEAKRKAEIQAEARKVVAVQNKDAEISEATANKLSGLVKVESEREVAKANVDKEKQIEIERQIAMEEIAIIKQKANLEQVEANRALQVGNAQVEKQALIEKAEGEAESVRKVGQANADVVTAEGKAAGMAIEAKGVAEAKAKEKMADASNRFDKEQGITIESIRAWVDVEKAKYEALGEALSKANVNASLVTSGGNEKPSSLLDLFGANGGANLAQMFNAFKNVSGGKEIIDSVKELINKDKKA